MQVCFYTNSLDRLIVEIDVGNFYILRFFTASGSTPNHDFGSDLAPASHQIFDGVIQSAVTMMHFEGWNVVGQCQQLVAQTDPKYRFIFF
jgi:hypothetical protein